jgi:hypothetical protein
MKEDDMARKTSLGLGVLGVVLVLIAVTVGVRGPRASAQDGLPGADTAAILDYVLNQNPYTEWGTWTADRWTDFGGVIESMAPHTSAARIYVNDVALEAVDAEDFDGVLPSGSIVIKESLQGTPDDPGGLAFLALMVKVEGFDPAGNDWYWLETDAAGGVLFEGAEALCIDCHSQPGHADYLLRYAYGDEPANVYHDPLPEANGAAIVDYVLNVDPYTAWGSWPAAEDGMSVDDFSGYLAGAEPHGSTVRIFVNDRALTAAAREDFGGILPPGSIVVKENYGGTPDAPGEVVAITLMYKVDGFNPEGNDWYWVRITGDGSMVVAEGAVEACVTCHAQDGNSDFLLRYDLPGMDDEMGEETDAAAE